VRTWAPDAVPPEAGLVRLLDGNRRFVEGRGAAYTGFRGELANGQSPFAVIVGCSDSRVPAEIVFDVGLGDLFVVRVAGNIVAPSQVGSVEFAVSTFGTRLVVVMGHTRCGAIAATLRTLSGELPDSKNIAAITDRIAPHIRGVPAEQAIAANVRASVDHLSHGSAILEELVRKQRLHIAGAVYAVETGEVSLLG
jgi:carbonic anhydrase